MADLKDRQFPLGDVFRGEVVEVLAVQYSRNEAFDPKNSTMELIIRYADGRELSIQGTGYEVEGVDWQWNSSD